MNPNSNSESFQLPSPVTEQAPVSNSSAETAPSKPEKVEAANPERSGQASAPPALPTTIPLPEPPAAPAQPRASGAVAINQDNPAQASDDADLIEKEWVTKTKQIVERNRNDPYKQSEELTVFKADYMKKRYNKTIKVSK